MARKQSTSFPLNTFTTLQLPNDIYIIVIIVIVADNLFTNVISKIKETKF